MKRSDTRGQSPARSPARIELILYVSGSSTSSIRAIANLRRLIRRYKHGQIAVSIRDLARNPDSGEHDQIAFTPTLCKVAPEPTMRILGDLSNPQPLLELLEFYGVDRKDGHS